MKDKLLWFFRLILTTAIFLFISTWTSLSNLAATLWSLIIVFVSGFLGEPIYYALGVVIVVIISIIGKRHANLIATIVSFSIVTVVSFVFANILIILINDM